MVYRCFPIMTEEVVIIEKLNELRYRGEMLLWFLRPPCGFPSIAGYDCSSGIREAREHSIFSYHWVPPMSIDCCSDARLDWLFI